MALPAWLNRETGSLKGVVASCPSAATSTTKSQSTSSSSCTPSNPLRRLGLPFGWLAFAFFSLKEFNNGPSGARFDKEGIDMMEIERPKIETASLSPDGRYGKFVAEPLERGFGITLGNSLRRVLLSSLPGVAVTSVKIDGVVHEFSTIEGVKEDVTEIVLNLKGIAAKLYTDGPKTVRVEAVGPCEVTADNIKQGDDIEILNPEWHIRNPGRGCQARHGADLRQGPRLCAR